MDLAAYMAWLEEEFPWYVSTTRRHGKIESLARSYLAQPAFQRPLRFGDAEQLALLREWRKAVDEALSGDLDGSRTGLRTFLVLYTHRIEDSITVDAEDEDEAEDRARDELDHLDDLEIDEVEAVQPPAAARAACSSTT